MEVTLDLPDILHDRLTEQAKKDNLTLNLCIEKMIRIGLVTNDLGLTMRREKE